MQRLRARLLSVIFLLRYFLLVAFKAKQDHRQEAFKTE